MKINRYTNNTLELQGRVAAVNEYSEGKAANITVAIDNGKDKDGKQRGPQYIQTKSFTPAAYSMVKTGMLIRIYGHVAVNNYTDKEGKSKYSTDLVADYIDFLESKQVVDQRESLKEDE